MEDTMMEVKEDFMLSPAGDSKPTLRTAHFLKPIQNTIDETTFKFNPFSSSSSVSELKEWPFTSHFYGWRYHQEKWVCWVDKLKLKYESVWKKAEILEAIMSTKCHIVKNRNLLYGIVEKWCCETNTFVFPFGEATITLEDVMVLGGYPVLGDPVFISLEDHEMREVEKKLILARQQLTNKKQGGVAHTSMWMDIFIDKGSEIEHEAFLATWLSLFVFPHKNYLVKSSLFSIAIHLARGNPIALAPAVLASLYRDLALLKKTIVDLSKFRAGGNRYRLEINILSPFYLVQIWVWERFINLQPEPMFVNHDDPLLLRWHKVKALNIDNVKLALDSAMDGFLWRPYVRYADKCGIFYPNDEILILLEKDLDKDMLSFVTCFRVSELVGFESIEQYLPHRVAMQFGMDQDVPNFVPRFNETKFIAWRNYCRPISDKMLYFPPRLFEADVTTRYAKWWKQLVLDRDDFVKKTVRRKRSGSLRKHRLHVGEFNTASSSDYENILPLKGPLSNDNIELSKGVLEDELKDANESKKARMCSDRVCLSDIQGESKSYGNRNMVFFCSQESGDFIAGCGDEDEIKSPFCDRNDVNDVKVKSVSALAEDRAIALENRIQKLERVIAKLKEARVGHRLTLLEPKPTSYF